MAGRAGSPHTLATDQIRIVIDPDRGGQLTSILDLATGRQWLAQPAASPPPLTYGASFTDGAMAGWDEMFPTIVAGSTPGIDDDLPDHGEVWSVPWTVRDAGPDILTLEVEGRARAYRLRRTAALASPRIVRLEYAVTVPRSVDAFPALWAAHPQLTWRAGGKVELPPSVASVVEVTAPGGPRSRPWTDDLAGWLDGAEPGTGCKLWTQSEDVANWCQLRDPDGGALTLRWDGSSLPHVGIWYDACAFSREPVVVLEPSNGYYDELALAVANGRHLELAGGGTVRWWLEVELVPGLGIREHRLSVPSRFAPPSHSGNG